MHVSNLSAQKAAQMIGKRLWLALMDAAEQSRHDSGWCSEPDRLGNKVKVGEQVHCGMMPITAPHPCPHPFDSGAQVARYFLTEDAYGGIEALWGHQATHVGLHEET